MHICIYLTNIYVYFIAEDLYFFFIIYKWIFFHICKHYNYNYNNKRKETLTCSSSGCSYQLYRDMWRGRESERVEEKERRGGEEGRKGVGSTARCCPRWQLKCAAYFGGVQPFPPVTCSTRQNYKQIFFHSL